MDKEIQKKILKSLGENAFDFLEQSIQEFDKDPKNSVTHFCIAVENILKYELMWEHWCLIFTKPAEASVDNLVKGSFNSVGLDDAIIRLNHIADRDIDDNAKKAFDIISEHRNKVIHFYHDEINKSNIAIDQCRAWYYMEILLKNWNSHFREFTEKRRNIQKLMKSHGKYINVKYSKIKKELEDFDNKKNLLLNCDFCKKRSILISKSQFKMQYRRCPVCDEVNKYFLIKDNNEWLDVFREGNKLTQNSTELLKQIEDKLEYHADIQHGGDVDWIANCRGCGSQNSVIKLDNSNWFCTECRETFDKVSRCEWCNELFAGGDEETYAFGCGFCDGYAGWQKDD